MDMFSIILILILTHFVSSEDICKTINCGSGICKTTLNPTLPYYCQCQNGSNSILPCPSDNPCSHDPCGQGTCEILPRLPYGYLCRCADDTISLTSCNTLNVCATNPCIHGICIEGLTSFICDCLPSWTGRTCNEKIESSCSNSLCGMGKCFSINDPSLPYVCLCPNAQFAMSCENTIKYPSTTARMLMQTARSVEQCNPLDPNSCTHGGQCLPIMNGYQCLCTSGFTGRYCEIKTNECASNPCLHGGICYDLQSSYICACPDGSFRSQCLSKPVTTSTARTLVCPCQNGGVCSLIGLPLCRCLQGFTGRFCENSINLGVNSCQQMQCLNDGTCYDNSTAPSCLCKSGFTGKFCEIEYFQCPANGRFMDQYNCEKGRYFECIHHGGGSNGVLLSRNCPSSLRFNVQIDGCDYPLNVKCLPN